jgi:hypothetical protein
MDLFDFGTNLSFGFYHVSDCQQQHDILMTPTKALILWRRLGN